MQSDLIMRIDSYDLTQHMDLIESPDFGLLPNISSETRNGKILSSSLGDQVYSFKFLLDHSRWTIYRDELIQALYGGTATKKLTISLFPDRFWNVVLDGDSQFIRDLESNGQVEVTLSFLIPEGYAHATVLTSVTAKKDSKGILSMEIDYDGTQETNLELSIKNNAETGYLGIIGMRGDENTFVTQLGYVDEADGETRTKMATIFPKDGGLSFDNWKKAATFYENPNKGIVTNMLETTDFGGWLGGLPADAKNTGHQWFGDAKELVLPTAVQNPYLWGRAWFETGVMGQTGIWTLAFVDEANKFICGMSIEKSDTAGNAANVLFLVGDGKGGSRVYNQIPFTPSYWLPPNPYGSQAKNENRNMFDLRKEGGKITFFWDGGYHSITLPELADKKLKRVQYYNGQYSGRTKEQLVSRMGLRDVLLIDLKSQYWENLPNRFSANTEVKIINNNGMNLVYRDGIQTLEDVITGSTFPVLKPGKNRIEFYHSDFTQIPPTITGTYEKRWY